jgi:hypothetical protein
MIEYGKTADDNDDNLFFENNFFSEQRNKNMDVSDPNEFIIGGSKKGSSLVVQSSQTR